MTITFAVLDLETQEYIAVTWNPSIEDVGTAIMRCVNEYQEKKNVTPDAN